MRSFNKSIAAMAVLCLSSFSSATAANFDWNVAGPADWETD